MIPYTEINPICKYLRYLDGFVFTRKFFGHVCYVCRENSPRISTSTFVAQEIEPRSIIAAGAKWLVFLKIWTLSTHRYVAIEVPSLG